MARCRAVGVWSAWRAEEADRDAPSHAGDSRQSNDCAPAGLLLHVCTCSTGSCDGVMASRQQPGHGTCMEQCTPPTGQLLLLLLCLPSFLSPEGEGGQEERQRELHFQKLPPHSSSHITHSHGPTCSGHNEGGIYNGGAMAGHHAVVMCGRTRGSSRDRCEGLVLWVLTAGSATKGPLASKK